MGNGAAEVVEAARKHHSFKVHRLMCTELLRLVDKISRIFPEIEAARPRCSTGIQALCLLNSGIEKAKLLLQHCSESSKLYLAFTGDVIVLRCQKSRNLLEQSLRQIQNWVPMMLVIQISQIADDLKGASFILDPSEEEAGRFVRELLHSDSSRSNQREDSEIKALQIASFRLHITSSKAILMEKRSIKKLLDKVGDNETRKKQILTYFMYLLNKHGKLITGKQTESASEQQQVSFVPENSGNGFESNQHAEIESPVGYGKSKAQSNLFRGAVPPEAFMCRISSRMMYDPVVIASGLTYERMWIQKWFDEGHDTCPKTNMKLNNLSLTPNITMKELISSWCTQNGVAHPDPSVQPEALSWETSSTSIASLGSSMNDLHLQMDFSNISFGSLDTSNNSDSSRNKIENGLSLAQNDNDSLNYQNAKKRETGVQFLSELGELQWESQCKDVEDVKNHLKCNPQASYAISSENFGEPLIKFLREAHDLDDVKAQRDGLELLMTLVSKSRNGIPYLREEAYNLLAYYLDSKVTEEVLAILEVVSGHQYCGSKISESGALTSILKLLDSQNKDLQGQAVKILRNLSLSKDICSKIVSLECIPKLVSFLKDDVLSGVCISIFKNLSDTEEARISIAETHGCIASIAELLETGSSEDQEHAVDILVSLCSQRDEYCQLVMHEGVIPSLVNLSNKGTERAKTSALEVRRLLRDFKYADEQECSGSADLDASRDDGNCSTEKKSSKTSGFFGKKMSMFSKTSSHAPKKKN
ncbi:U-box domain-containing protein 5-like [Malus sylvestris]|uniref:U-box domain-containing protein 5-like n=1 Tax=Malus sylvestris TaxID=3752 RepID=UPI0021ABDBF9|nr:U-box domain-containing protein 5-like [Malus sylvestris]XP_050135136.1 U-box domain-containing protein 5-like [Malus sylvestris]XP_050135144.1 U-box domain-containing protein 5-like [Malus sylvestris]XP_050135146.1 U-box domain-containing protein 5-like [Malus sylvestris]